MIYPPKLLGSLPGPIIFGQIIDNSCILWKKNCADENESCLLYDNNAFARNYIVSKFRELWKVTVFNEFQLQYSSSWLTQSSSHLLMCWCYQEKERFESHSCCESVTSPIKSGKPIQDLELNKDNFHGKSIMKFGLNLNWEKWENLFNNT